MVKTEDFNVSELQELVIKHNCGARRTQSRARSSYAEPQPAIALDLIVKCKVTIFNTPCQ